MPLQRKEIAKSPQLSPPYSLQTAGAPFCAPWSPPRVASSLPENLRVEPRDQSQPDKHGPTPDTNPRAVVDLNDLEKRGIYSISQDNLSVRRLLPEEDDPQA